VKPSEWAQGCIAHPCAEARVEGSGFCAKHKAEHEKIRGKLSKYKK